MSSTSPRLVPAGGTGVWRPMRRVASGTRSLPRSREAGAFVLIAALMILYPFQYDSGRTNLSLGDGLVLVVSFAYLCRALRRPVPLPKYMAWVLGLALVGIASTTFNTIRPPAFFTGPRTSLVEIGKLVMAGLWMWVIFLLLSRRFATRFLHLAGTSVLVSTAAALGAIAMTVTESTDTRPTGPFENAGLFAGYLSFNAFLALAARGVLLDCSRREHLLPPRLQRLAGSVLIVGCVPVLLLGMVSTGSRGALVGTALALPLCGLCRLRIPTVRQVIVLAAVVLVGSIGLHWYVRQDPLVLKRLVDTAEGDPKGVEERLMLWQAARETFEEHPVLGVGYGQFRAFALAATGESKVAHQTYLAIGAELGVIGLVVFAWLMLTVLRDTSAPDRRPYPVVTRAGRGYVLAMLVQGMSMNVQHSRALWICLGVLAVLAAPDVTHSCARPERSGRVWRQP